jgi:hypothetical protein
MGFTLSIRTDFIQIDSWHYYPELEANVEHEDIDLAGILADCCNPALIDDDDLAELVSRITNKEYADGVASALDPYQPITVSIDGQDDFEIEGMEDVEMPEASELVPDEVSSKFCYLKVWENGGTFEYEDDGDFDENLISYKNGKLLYDGNEFQLVDGEGSYSYREFYRDGECVYRGG